MKRSSGPRKTASLSQSTNHKLNTYALAASAAGVGILALIQPAQAKIVYTHTHQAIGGIGHGVNIDFNHDGIADFKISEGILYDDSFVMVAVSLRGNRVLGERVLNAIGASDLPAGYPVGPNNAKFKPGDSFITDEGQSGIGKFLYFCTVGSGNGRYCDGPWATATGGYVGFRFLIKGEVHYGWARFTGYALQFGSWYLDGYAYETIPNKPIMAGETKGDDDESIDGPDASLTVPAAKPATLGLLAMGSPALSIWRRKDEPASAR